MKLTLDTLHISEHNTRQPTARDVGELAASMQAAGQLTPILVRPFPGKEGHYEIAAGARRFVATRANGGTEMDATVREMDDSTFLEAILIENLQRLDPDPKAEAQLVAHLVAQGATADTVSARCGKPASWTARRMRLLKVEPSVLKRWIKGTENGNSIAHFSVEMMELIGSLPPELQTRLVKDWEFCRSANRKQLEAIIQKQTLRLDNAPFDLADPRFFGPCNQAGCASDSSKQSELFDFGGKVKAACGRCLNPSCFNARLAKWRAVEYEALCGDKELPIVKADYQGDDEVVIGARKVAVSHVRNLASTESKGATKVLLLEHGKLKVAWHKPESHGDGRRSKVPLNPTQRRAEGVRRLQGNRWLKVREELVAHLKAAPKENLSVDLVDLVAALGLPYCERAEGWSKPNTEAWKLLDGRKDGSPTNRAETRGYDPDAIMRKKTKVPRDDALWNAMQAVLLGLMPVPKRINEACDWLDTYQHIADLTGFALAGAKTKADLAILPPKSWGPMDPHTLKASKQEAVSSKQPEKAKAPSGGRVSGAPPPKMSPEARAKIVAAQKKRWAAWKARKG